jgi:hypothetical protein
MKKTLIMLLAVLVLGSMFIACAENKEHSDKSEKATVSESKESHERDYKTGESEEDGTEFAKTVKFIQTKNGVKLILAYNEEASAFMGTVENVTEKSLSRVRVEIHLSNGKELGPTTPIALVSGEIRKVKLNAVGEKFELWSTHAEVGSSEGGESEHSSRESGEHNSEKESSEHR